MAVVRELAKGRPIPREALAASLGWLPQKLTGLLEYASSTEYDDDQNIVGYGITLRQTAHAFEVDGRRLYTWCALDTLMFPALRGKTAAVFRGLPSLCRTSCPRLGVPQLRHVARYSVSRRFKIKFACLSSRPTSALA